MASGVLGEEFFEDVVTAVLKDVTGVLIPGSQIATVLVGHASRAFFKVLGRLRREDRQAAVDAVAKMPFGRSKDIAARQVANSGLSADQQAELVAYLSAIPMTARRAVQRPDDGGRITTLVSQLPRNPDQAARFVPARPPRFQPGDTLAAHDYRLDTLLGMGGFAEVWKARNTEYDKDTPVALKFCLDPALVPSLRKEIRLLDRLEGHDPDKDFVRLIRTAYGAETPFVVYEYIDGGNLADWLEGFAGASPSIREVLSVLKMTARAMAFAHENGVVHRDLKPANLLMTRKGRVKVADFGIGAAMADHEAAVGSRAGIEATQQSILQGAYTPMYSDPMRDRFAAPDPQVDVYAMGVIAYQLLMGDFSRRMEGGWLRLLGSQDVPAGLAEIVETCVAPPEDRYRDSGAFLAALERIDDSSAARRRSKPRPEPSPGPRQDPPVRRFCHNCGTEAMAGMRFCLNCGYEHPAS